MRSLRGCESQPRRAVSTHPLSSPTCSEVGESHGSFVELRSITPPLNFDEAGGIRIGQTRVTLDSLLAAYDAGSTPEEIAVQYPILTLAEIYATITYYFTHPQQVEDYLEERRQMAQQRRTQIAQDNNLIGLRQRLLDRGQSQISNI